MRRGSWLLAFVLTVAACGGDSSVDGSVTTNGDDPEGTDGATTTVAPPRGEAIAFAMNLDGELLAVDPESESAEVIAEVENASFLWTVDGEPWVGHRERLIHFDASGQEQGSIDLWGPQALAADGGVIWVISLSQSTPNGILSKIDPAAASATDELLTEDGAFFDDVAAGDGQVWVSYDGLDWDSKVSAVDPGSLSITSTIDLPIETQAMTSGEGSLWVAGQVVEGGDDDAAIVRIGPDGTIEAEIALDAASRQLDVVVAFGSVWVADANGATLIQIDPATNSEVARFDAGAAAVTDPRRLRVFSGSGSLWVDNPADDTVYEIDPATGEQLSSFAHRAIVFAFR